MPAHRPGLGTIVLGASLSQKAHQGGLTWVYLQYLLGFKRLGWDVLLVDRLEPEMCLDAAGKRCAAEQSVQLHYLQQVTEAYGLSDCWAVGVDGGTRYLGLPRHEVLARVADSAALLNVMGFVIDHGVLERARTLVFLDIDPGFGQMWCALGLHNPYDDYDQFVTVGENIGRPECVIPTCGRTWIPFRQPVVLETWPSSPGPRDGRFTSIGAWRGPYGPIEYGGRTFGLRAHELRKFIALPRVAEAEFELALEIHPADGKDAEALQANGWHLTDPMGAAGNPAAYQDYIRASRGELLVAKNMYVQSNSGWFSDRSICYLATGRPVIAQDTGLKDLYRTGSGLLTFSTLDEAVAAVRDVSTHYDEHCHAARLIAEEYFDSDIVLPRLLVQLGIG